MMSNLDTRKKVITREDLISIAKAGFPDHIHSLFWWHEVEAVYRGEVTRLTKKPDHLGREDILVIEYLFNYNGHSEYIRLDAGLKQFNHLYALREMERLGYIETK